MHECTWLIFMAALNNLLPTSGAEQELQHRLYKARLYPLVKAGTSQCPDAHPTLPFTTIQQVSSLACFDTWRMLYSAIAAFVPPDSTPPMLAAAAAAVAAEAAAAGGPVAAAAGTALMKLLAGSDALEVALFCCCCCCAAVLAAASAGAGARAELLLEKNLATL